MIVIIWRYFSVDCWGWKMEWNGKIFNVKNIFFKYMKNLFHHSMVRVEFDQKKKRDLFCFVFLNPFRTQSERRKSAFVYFLHHHHHHSMPRCLTSIHHSTQKKVHQRFLKLIKTRSRCEEIIDQRNVKLFSSA